MMHLITQMTTTTACFGQVIHSLIQVMGNINHIYENGVVDANGNKFTATQKANETLTIGANHLKQTSFYPSSQNRSLDADEAKQKNMIKQPQPLSAEEREKKIQYYTDLFYMSNHSYDEYVDDDAYDAIHVTDLYEEDIKSFEDKFAALGALDTFYQIYLDSCQDALAKFNHRLAEENSLLKAKNNGLKMFFTNKCPLFEKKSKFKPVISSSNLRTQKELETNIVKLKEKLANFNPTAQEEKTTGGKPKAAVQQVINAKINLSGVTENSVVDVSMTIPDAIG